MKILFAMVGLLAAFSTSAQDLKPYQLYSPKGKEKDYGDLLKAAKEADVVFFGEHHDNPICHWLQLRLTKDLYEAKGQNLTIGMEMFERDNQLAINEYFLGYVTDKNFEKEVRLWPNYKTDYKPILEFAREKGLKLVATNIPRRYASLVSKRGLEALDSLPAASKKYMMPLPISVDLSLHVYKEMMAMGMGGGTAKFAHAQAVKDACMAYFIHDNLEKGECHLHLNGTYHSDFHEGIVHYLKKLRPELKILVIASASTKEGEKPKEEDLERGDFILALPEDMTRTH